MKVCPKCSALVSLKLHVSVCHCFAMKPEAVMKSKKVAMEWDSVIPDFLITAYMYMPIFKTSRVVLLLKIIFWV